MGYLLSSVGLDLLRLFEGEPILTSTNVGDGVNTVGWGHAHDPRYPIGTQIDLQTAVELLKADVAKYDPIVNSRLAGAGYLTQNQYDAVFLLQQA